MTERSRCCSLDRRGVLCRGAVALTVALSVAGCSEDFSSADPWNPGPGASSGAMPGSDDGASPQTTTFHPTPDSGSGDDGSPPDDGWGDSSGEPPLPPLPCDVGFAFDPIPLGSGTVSHASFTFDQPLTYVGMTATGPGAATFGDLDIEGGDSWTWTWTVTDLAPGIWTFSFFHGEAATTIATCERHVVDTGLPPGLPEPPPPPPTGDCGEGQVCGDAGPGGGTCDRCPMVGECLSPPSPYGPSGPGEWSCLDSAGCSPDSGVCQIWCPGEPCNEAEHPDGCPQGVEACFVSAAFTSYEDACASCCESRFHEPTGEFACWDTAFSLCRYPTDCGLPLW